MFDISWSELLILAIVTLVFVGPKELPVFLRTLGRYAGTVRRHANDFKAQFDAAMREAELDSMRKEVEQMQTSINSEVMRAKTSIVDAGAAAKLETPSVATTLEPASTPSAPIPLPPLPTPASEMAAEKSPSPEKTES
ncbi:MAG: Sec-independent protein translocase protein TatB [Hyphomicrobium sp.]